MKKYLPTLSLLPLLLSTAKPTPQKIYTCEVNARLSIPRVQAATAAVNDLPIVGKYSSSRYDTPVSDAPTLDAPTSQTAPAKSKNTAAKSNHKATPKPAPVRTASKRLLLRFQILRRQQPPLYFETELSNERAGFGRCQKNN